MPKKLLMIEDDSEVRLVVARLAKRKSWEFHGAGNAQDGLALAARVAPDFIIIDVQLPDREGWDVCRDLKKHQALGRVPILIVSGRRMSPEDQALGIQIGADDYLVKPFDASELWMRVEAILRARSQARA